MDRTEKKEGSINESIINTLLTSMTLVVDAEKLSEQENIDSFVWSLAGYDNLDNQSPNILFDAFELFLRQMVSISAFKIYTLSYPNNSILNRSNFKKYLSASSYKHVALVDQHFRIWENIRDYFKSIIKNHKRGYDGPGLSYLDKVAWDFYFLTLAFKNGCEVFIDPTTTISSIDNLMKESGFTKEDLFRLSKIRGIFHLLANCVEIDGFRVVAKKTPFLISERIDEILEDAYLMESSALKKFFALNPNKASIKRDIRKITKFIVSNRKWAKGILTTAQQYTFPAGDAAFDKLSNILTSIDPNPTVRPGAILLKPDYSLYGYDDTRNEILIQSHKSIATNAKPGWVVSFR